MTNEGAHELANAIIVQACKDYRSALKKLKRNPRHSESQRTKGSCERFFRSEWFEVLSDLDGEALISMIRKDVDYDS